MARGRASFDRLAWFAAALLTLAFGRASHGQCDRWYPFTAGGQTGVGTGTVDIKALTVWNGHVIAGGFFTTAGGQTCNYIARWDGSAWHPLTSGGQIGLNERVNAMTVWNGHLIVGGDFTTAGGQTVNKIARWDGTTWHPFTVGADIGMGGVSTGVHALTVWNNELIAGGYFTSACGTPANRVARWNGTSWQAFGPGFDTGPVWTLASWNGNLYAGGVFTFSGGTTLNEIARWDGAAWQPLQVNGSIGTQDTSALTVWNNMLIVGGNAANTPPPNAVVYNQVVGWNGTAWQTFVVGPNIGTSGDVRSLTVWNGQLVAGGLFLMAGGTTVNRIARWNGTTWTPFTFGGQTGVNGQVSALTVWNGDLIAAGTFTTAGGMTVNKIARWDACCVGDTNNDNFVNINDLLAVIIAWGACPAGCPTTACPADIAPPGGNCTVNINDLLAVIIAWGPCP